MDEAKLSEVMGIFAAFCWEELKKNECANEDVLMALSGIIQLSAGEDGLFINPNTLKKIMDFSHEKFGSDLSLH